MKKMLFFWFIFVAGLMSSCITESPRWERVYQIKNNSGYNVVIRSFENFNGTGMFDDIILLDNDVFVGSEVSGTNFDALNNLNSTRPSSSLNGSRFIVVYNDEKKHRHSFEIVNENTVFSDPVSRNLLRSGNYTDIGNNIYEFTLTEEDYNNAEPCNGDCLD